MSSRANKEAQLTAIGELSWLPEDGRSHLRRQSHNSCRGLRSIVKAHRVPWLSCLYFSITNCSAPFSVAPSTPPRIHQHRPFCLHCQSVDFVVCWALKCVCTVGVALLSVQTQEARTELHGRWKSSPSDCGILEYYLTSDFLQRLDLILPNATCALTKPSHRQGKDHPPFDASSLCCYGSIRCVSFPSCPSCSSCVFFVHQTCSFAIDVVRQRRMHFFFPAKSLVASKTKSRTVRFLVRSRKATNRPGGVPFYSRSTGT